MIAEAELFLYDVGAHMFTESSAEGYDAKATEQVVERAIQFLGRVGRTAAEG